jgi:hypothetical protein
MNRAEALQQVMAAPEGEDFIIVRKSQRHLNKAGEPKKYIRVEVLETQRMAWDDMWETLIEQSNGQKTLAFDRLLSAMGHEIASGLLE